MYNPIQGFEPATFGCTVVRHGSVVWEECVNLREVQALRSIGH